MKHGKQECQSFFKLIYLYLISYLMHSHSKGMKIEKETENGSWKYKYTKRGKVFTISNITSRLKRSIRTWGTALWITKINCTESHIGHRLHGSQRLTSCNCPTEKLCLSFVRRQQKSQIYVHRLPAPFGNAKMYKTQPQCPPERVCVSR